MKEFHIALVCLIDIFTHSFLCLFFSFPVPPHTLVDDSFYDDLRLSERWSVATYGDFGSNAAGSMVDLLLLPLPPWLGEGTDLSWRDVPSVVLGRSPGPEPLDSCREEAKPESLRPCPVSALPAVFNRSRGALAAAASAADWPSPAPPPAGDPGPDPIDAAIAPLLPTPWLGVPPLWLDPPPPPDLPTPAPAPAAPAPPTPPTAFPPPPLETPMVVPGLARG